jgi:predicted metal-dependent hydrolase
LVALSFTLPYLEPYLIRTMRSAAKRVDDPELRSDMKAFSSQEAQHYRNHARINDIVRSQLSSGAASDLRSLEDELEADYRRYSDERTLAFNLAYAEGFESMTFAFARSVFSDRPLDDILPEWADLITWHLAEEVEHRTVTFDAYERIVGRYPHRVAVGTWAQGHFLRSLLRMSTVLQRELIDPNTSFTRVVLDAARRNWRNGAIPGTMRALSPTYHPARVPLSEDVRRIAASQGVDLG